MTRCTYRAATECRLPIKMDNMSVVAARDECKLCLMGMLCDEVGLNTSAIMSMSADCLEKKVN